MLAGKYRLDRILGIGGMGAVFAAENTWLSRQVAVKLMHPDVSADPALVERFLREARAAARISHPNVVDVLDLGQDEDGTLFIVQEFLHGTDLRHLMDERGTLPPREALEILTPVMSALIAAHRKGVLHRDVKPENCFLAKAPGGGVVVKLLDFGIAKMQESVASKDLTQTGIALGTVHYLSPEQAAGAKDIDAQADVWSMATVLYEMLSGRCPFESDSVNAIFAAVLMSPVPSIQSFAPSVPDALAAIIMRALERDRTKRYRSMQAFLGALLDCPIFNREPWHTTLRITHHAAATLPNAPIECEREPIEDPTIVDVMRMAPKEATPPRMTTFGRTAREIQIPIGKRFGSSLERFLVGLLTVTAIGIAVSVSGTIWQHGSRVAIPTTRSAVTRTFEAVFDVAGATIDIDGVPMGTNRVAVRLPVDGRSHIARCYAPGRIERRVIFRDELPLTRFELEPIQPVAAPVAVAVPMVRRTRPAAAQPAAASAAHPTATPLRPVPDAHQRNGAPILGLDE
jgi:serine/threonine-protein kinase